MSSFYILGIDQSTQGTKVVLFDKDGKIIARADAAHKQIVNDQNWVSHDLEEIYANVIKAARQVVEKAGIDKKQIVCIGIDNQRETTAAWNRKQENLLQTRSYGSAAEQKISADGLAKMVFPVRRSTDELA